MLSKKRRVNRALFSKVLSKNKSFNGKNISLRVFFGEYLNEPRFSFVVSKKVSNKANKRNFLKKRGYSVVKNIIKQTRGGAVCLFYFKKNATLLSFKDLKKEITTLLKESNILK